MEKDITNLLENSELKQLAIYRDRLSVVTLSGGARLIIRDKTEILIPKRLRPKMIEILNFRHSWDDMMWKYMKNKIFWPRMLEGLRKKYEMFETCSKHRMLKAQAHNEILYFLWNANISITISRLCSHLNW